MKTIILAVVLCLILAVSRPPLAHAWFCGDPSIDSCAIPNPKPEGRPDGAGSVRKETHPTADYYLVPGKTLRKNFDAWAKEAGWKIVWKSEYTFPVKARYMAGRTFLGAVRRSIRIFNASSGSWLRVKAFAGNHVLLVEDGRD
jgi:epoxyqueuosine reductase QueG